MKDRTRIAIGSTKVTNMTARCPSCGEKLDAATSIGERDATAAEGDFAICAYSHSLLCFRADQTLREPTKSEIADFRRHYPETAARLRHGR